MRPLVEALCSMECAGRKPGTAGGLRARGLVTSAMRDAGVDPVEQAVPGCGGANVLATLPGDDDRWIVIGAHFDHLGVSPRGVFTGADDNAAAVAILVELARALSIRRPRGRGVVLAAFDGEEPPYYSTDAMGSQRYVQDPIVPLERTDFMVCMDLVGHALGPAAAPASVRQTLFALGAERSQNTGGHVDALAQAVDGVTVRRADAEIIPPLSDYLAFWAREVPFLFLTAGRSRVYHTPEDRPALLDYAKMDATARWLERFVRETCEREDALAPLVQRPDDVSTLESVIALTQALASVSPQAALGLETAQSLRAACGADGALPAGRREEARALVGALEAALA